MQPLFNFSSIPIPETNYDDYLHRPLVVTNEDSCFETLKIMSKRPVIYETILGVGCFFTLDVASLQGTKSIDKSRSIKHIIIFDRGYRVEHFWQNAEKIIKESENRLEVIEKIKALLKTHANYYFKEYRNSDSPEQEAANECAVFDTAIEKHYSWLSDDIRFEKIKNIFINNCFYFGRVDLFRKLSLDWFKEAMNANKLDAAYLSNLGEFCLNEEDYQAGMDQILSPETAVIAAHFSGDYENAMQGVMLRKKTPIRQILFPKVAQFYKQALNDSDFDPYSSRLSSFIFTYRLQYIAIIALSILFYRSLKN